VMSAIVMGVLLPFTGRLVGIEGGAMWLKYSLYTLLAVILIELPTLLYMIRIVSKPLGELTEAAWSLSRGNVARRVNISSDDEMGVLASAFNIMAANLERDINELRRLNQAIAEEKNLSRNVFDSIELSIVVLDTEGRVLEWNRAQEQWTGEKRADALGRLIVSELLPHVREKIVDAEMFREVVDTGRPVRRYNVPLPERDGPPRRIVNVTLVPLIDQDGARYGSVVILEDVTELKALERDLVRQAKLASVGVLASGIVHEVNNPLASISSLLQFLKDEEADEERRATFKTMIDQVQRVATTLQGVVDFARQRPAEKREMDVGALVASTVKFISFDKRFKHVKIHESYAPALPKVLGDWDQIQQVVMNLMFNAADAMPDGGDLYVSAGASETGGVWFEVRDTGHGIPDDALDKIFDPFFTTKPTGKGTGLGLSVCDGIIQSHGGAIAVRTARGVGSTFRVTLPAAPAAAREEEETA
ncbi:MAG: PAS domain-containing protein, partial [Candidatus Methylomirabilis sp.]|nr:PAS domain-containing protein [Deltaproteobacteria bacterium]